MGEGDITCNDNNLKEFRCVKKKNRIGALLLCTKKRRRRFDREKEDLVGRHQVIISGVKIRFAG